ncbi:unnamed protein product [Calypogeia fissa]
MTVMSECTTGDSEEALLLRAYALRRGTTVRKRRSICAQSSVRLGVDEAFWWQPSSEGVECGVGVLEGMQEGMVGGTQGGREAGDRMAEQV